jgi:hypothetical protein
LETKSSVEVDMDFEVLKSEPELEDPQTEVLAEVAEGVEAGEKPKKRRRRRKLISPAHEARIEAYRALVEERGWIFSPPSPPQPVSALFQHLTDNQVESLSA